MTGARYSVLGTRTWFLTLTVATLLATLTTAATAAPQASGDSKLMPPDGFQNGWAKAGPPRVFTSADLYGHINGGAEAFLEVGFEQLTVQRYRSGAEEVTVELYRMTDPAAARGIYLARCGTEARDPGLRERHTVSRQQLLLQRHRYYLIVSNVSGAAATAPMLVKAAAEVAFKLPADTPVPALDLLPKTGLVPGSERLLRGPFGLQAIYTLGDGDMLQLGGTITAVSGDYRDAALGPHTRIVAEYPTETAATGAFKSIRASLDSYLKPLTATDARLVFQDFEKKFGVVSVAGRRLTVVVHLAKPPA
jgi:hypothetical protein